MRRRARKSKNINSVDVFKGLWVRPMRNGSDQREQSNAKWMRPQGAIQCEKDATAGSNPFRIGTIPLINTIQILIIIN